MASMNHLHGKLNESSNFSVRFILWIRSGIAKKHVKMLHTIQGVAPKLKSRRQDIWCAMKIEITMLQLHSHRKREREAEYMQTHIAYRDRKPREKCITIIELKFHIGPWVCVREWQIDVAKMINDQMRSINDNEEKNIVTKHIDRKII